jgi:hypothetical protein
MTAQTRNPHLAPPWDSLFPPAPGKSKTPPFHASKPGGERAGRKNP